MQVVFTANLVGCGFSLSIVGVITYPFVNYLAFNDNTAYPIFSTKHF